MIRPATLTEIEIALSANDIPGAANLAESALARGEDDALILNLAAWKREELRDFAGAEALLQRAHARSPHDPHVRVGLGAVMRKQGRTEDAIGLLRGVVQQYPGISAAWLELGYALDASGVFAAALAHYGRAAELDPHLAAPLGMMSSLLARTGQMGEARAVAEQTLALDAGNAAALMARARCDLADKEFTAAHDAMVSLVLRTELSLEEQVLAQQLLADALDQTGDCKAAYGAYEKSKALFSKLDPNAEHQAQRAFVERILGSLDQIPPQDIASANFGETGTAARAHAFLLGFPRSGTTLVENILTSLKDVEALEERPTLHEADKAFLLPADGMANLATCDPAKADQLRKSYWDYVAASGIDVRGKLFVDMDPLKGIKLPVIARLFPGAKIIVMRRDPREVVWSCFKTGFAKTSAAFEFTTLERAARHYDAVMRLTEACLERFPLAVFNLRYDALVTEFDETTKALCTFLDIPWSDEVRAFSKTADRRGVSTASAIQVRQGLYDGRGQWRRYEAEMSASLPILAPWVEKLGFV